MSASFDLCTRDEPVRETVLRVASSAPIAQVGFSKCTLHSATSLCLMHLGCSYAKHLALSCCLGIYLLLRICCSPIVRLVHCVLANLQQGGDWWLLELHSL